MCQEYILRDAITFLEGLCDRATAHTFFTFYVSSLLYILTRQPGTNLPRSCKPSGATSFRPETINGQTPLDVFLQPGHSDEYTHTHI